MKGTKEFGAKNPVITGVLELEAMTLTFFAQPSDSPGECAVKSVLTWLWSRTR